MKARILVLISGGGSNLQCLIDAARAPECPYEIVHVISNRPSAGGLVKAAHAGIGNTAIDHKAYPSRTSFEQALTACIETVRPDFIVCAGFMRVLTEAFVAQYEGKMINIHPSLLPNFPGLNTYQRAIDAGVAFAGCTVHWVSAGVDEGAIIGQAIVALLPGDTPDTLAARILVQEHRLYPKCVALVATRRAVLKDGYTLLDSRRGAVAMLDDGSVVNLN